MTILAIAPAAGLLVELREGPRASRRRRPSSWSRRGGAGRPRARPMWRRRWRRPALLTQASMRPKRATVSRAMRATSSRDPDVGPRRLGPGRRRPSAPTTAWRAPRRRVRRARATRLRGRVAARGDEADAARRAGKDDDLLGQRLQAGGHGGLRRCNEWTHGGNARIAVHSRGGGRVAATNGVEGEGERFVRSATWAASSQPARPRTCNASGEAERVRWRSTRETPSRPCAARRRRRSRTSRCPRSRAR